MGLPLPLVGSGHCAARRSARPFGAFSASVCRLRRPCYSPSAASLRSFAAASPPAQRKKAQTRLSSLGLLFLHPAIA
ncbi:hypothetical protein SGRA_2378 [Saprospira grandis str. Lewin]|uniref:Uncharacterized protein n=1 Tax=Saprospira grandis (strain Lewin) TaxID=984262 RepID=H6L4T2_SAPGL|nr:hypothetical protein SGRA_2378 [Saprospira grandis str. Lewin]